MALKADKTYNATVREGSALITSNSGTIGYQVLLECEDGDCSFVIWLTPKTRDMAKKSFEVLGISEKQLQNPVFLEYEAANVIEGREVSFVARAEEYNGKTMVKVSGLRPKNEALGTSLSVAAARFFGGKAETSPVKDEEENTIEDDQIPF